MRDPATAAKSVVSDEERRVARRKQITLQATVQLPDGTTLNGHTVDISMSGAALMSPQQLQSAQVCTLIIDMSTCGTDLSMTLQGNVCYSLPQASGMFRTGMHFVRMDQQTSALLRSLMG